MSVRAMLQNLDGAKVALEELREIFSKQYWYAHPEMEGADVICHLCGFIGRKHIGTPNGYLCPEQPHSSGEGKQCT